MQPTITCCGNVRETGQGLEPELLGYDPANWDQPEPEPLTGWLEEDQLTLVEHAHISSRGTIGCRLYDHEETGAILGG